MVKSVTPPTPPTPPRDPNAPYAAEFHIGNKWLEERTLPALTANGSVTLYGPSGQGKSWWRQRLIEELRPKSHIHIAELDFSPEGEKTYENFNSFIFRFLDLLHVALFKKVSINRQQISIDQISVRDLFNLLDEWHEHPNNQTRRVLLSIDHIDGLIGRSYQDDVFGPLRTLLQERLRWVNFLLCLTTLPIFLQQSWRRSPLSLGDTVRLPDLEPEGVRRLAKFFELKNLTNDDFSKLSHLIGGNPYLNRLAFYEAQQYPEVAFGELLDEAIWPSRGKPPGGRLFATHLDSIRGRLGSKNRHSLKEVDEDYGLSVDDDRIRTLSEFGLIIPKSTSGYEIRYLLYRHLL